ncbi:outer membrane beta-barrel protein [Aliifodinibius salicampi]|uniref:Outer membrane beta-barrel protein n=1 Tax=Fodinibius salicampi TaxID=1920655 RepID=A0ABT3PZR5_9BACT|nr:outer membrane beta-barrel protein [Fodinibius salicampi]MCW9713377.1 outer membrane beta-barrel protein [Fodinibius salicampi]
MDIKKLLFGLATFALLISSVPQKVAAQWSLGASYEIRDEEPENGFGVRLERDILQRLPIVNLGLRGHFSYFNEENSLSRDGVTYSRELTNYDYGLAAVGGVSVGLVAPYVGLGLGSSTMDVNRDDLPEDSPFDEDGSDSAIYWNGFVGAEISPVPLLTPFVEYRLEQVSNYENLDESIKEGNGRLIFGVSINF